MTGVAGGSFSQYRTLGSRIRRCEYAESMVRRADDLSTDPAVVLIEEPAESFDAWLRELLVDPPVELGTTGADLVAQARADEA